MPFWKVKARAEKKYSLKPDISFEHYVSPHARYTGRADHTLCSRRDQSIIAKILDVCHGNIAKTVFLLGYKAWSSQSLMDKCEELGMGMLINRTNDSSYKSNRGKKIKKRSC